MSGDGGSTPSGWVAPSPAPLPVTRSPVSNAPPATLPPNGSPPAFPPPPASPPRRGLPWWAWILIAVGAAGLVVAAWIVVAALGGAISASGVFGFDRQAVVAGDPGLRPADDPVDCPKDCLSWTAAWAIGPSQADLEPSGLTERIVNDQDVPVHSSEEEQASALETWSNGSRDCLFVNSYLPVRLSYDEPSGPSTEVDILGVWSDRIGSSTLAVGTAYFGDSASAVAHVEWVAERIAGCTGYQVEDFDGSLVEVSVVPAPGLPDLDPSIASAGWIEDSVNGRFYIYELQRGEIAARVSVSTSGAITQADAEALVTKIAARLARQAVLTEPAV